MRHKRANYPRERETTIDHEPWPLPLRATPSVSARQLKTPTWDDEEERRVRLLLLGKATVLAHRYERPLAAEMDESEQRHDEPITRSRAAASSSSSGAS
jgi:hypothetical protein